MHITHRHYSFFSLSKLFVFLFSEKEQQEAIEHIDEVQNEIDR